MDIAQLMRSMFTGGGSSPLTQLIGSTRNDPQAQSVLKALLNGKDPKLVYEELCKQRGIDPQAFLSSLKERR